MNYVFLISVLVAVALVIGIATFTNFSLNNEQYDRLKWVVIRWSYFVTFLGLLVKTFDIPYGVETVTIVAGIGAMLSGLLGVSTVQFKNVIEATEEEETPMEDEGESEVE